MSAGTLAEQAEAMRVVAALADAFEHLPAAGIAVSTHYPDKIEVSLHDNLGDFEVWREALRIPADAVTFRSVPSQSWLTALGAFAGAAVELVGYGAPLPGGAA